jgi:hypothetical protein
VYALFLCCGVDHCLCLSFLQNAEKGFSDCFGNEVLQVRACGQAYVSLGINIRCVSILLIQYLTPTSIDSLLVIIPIMCNKRSSATIVPLK